MNINEIRKNIICKKNNLYLDFTASGLAYLPIEKNILKILKTYANIHSEFGEHAKNTSNYYKLARNSLYKNLEISKKDFYILPSGTGSTGAIKKFQEIVGLYLPPKTAKRIKILKDKPLVIVGPYEHHSNEISYREAICETIRVPLKNGSIDFSFLENILKRNKGREIYGCFSAASNVTGIISPVSKISKILRKYGAFVCIDAATFSPYGNIKSNLYDVLFLSPHKLIGGISSCGILVISKTFFSDYNIPTFAGGGTVDYVSKSKQIYLKNIEEAENAGTPGVIQLIRAAEAYELRNKIGLKWIEKKEKKIVDYFFKKSKEVDDMIIYHQEEKKRLAIFSFNIKGFDHHFLAQELSEKYGIQTRSGCSCAGPYGHYLLDIKDGFDYKKHGKPGWVRVGFFYIYNEKDIDFFINSLKEIIEKKKI